MDARLPAHLEVQALIRLAEARGGFGMVLARGSREGGTLLLVTLERGGNASLWERMPTLEGPRKWTAIRRQDPEKVNDFNDYLSRRRSQDPDLWLVELDVAEPQRFVDELGTARLT